MKNTANIFNLILPRRGSEKATIPLAALLLLSLAGTALAQGTAFTYQGQLNANGSAATGFYDLRFTIYDAATNGDVVSGVLTNAATPVTNGLFTVTLDFGSGVFTGDARWLEIGARLTYSKQDFTTLSPRQGLTPCPYALYAATAGSLNTSSNQPISFFAGGGLILQLLPNAISPSLVGGSPGNDLDPGVFGAVIAGGGTLNDILDGDDDPDGKPPPGSVEQNRVKANYSNVGGGKGNLVDKKSGSAHIGGGRCNNIGTNSPSAVIAGGDQNEIQGSARASSIGGGKSNLVAVGSEKAHIGGGEQHLIDTASPHAHIGGGLQNTIGSGSEKAHIGGGEQNLIDRASPHAHIGGGKSNLVAVGSEKAHIGGGEQNLIDEASPHAHIGGGLQNTIGAESEKAHIGGGEQNLIDRASPHAHIGGGLQNTIGSGSEKAHIGGGASNEVDAAHSSISGGLANTIMTNSDYSAVGGGYQNTVTANASSSTIPGGSLNIVAATNGFAAGHRAQAIHQGAFVWADSQEADFASSQSNQFAVRAQNGVLIQAQTNGIALELATGGAIKVTGAGVGTGTPVFIHRATADNTSAHITTIDNPLCNGDANAILIVTHNWNQDTASPPYETVPVGVWYNGAQWTIFHENTSAAMPVGRAFNVMVVKP